MIKILSLHIEAMDITPFFYHGNRAFGCGSPPRIYSIADELSEIVEVSSKEELSKLVTTLAIGSDEGKGQVLSNANDRYYEFLDKGRIMSTKIEEWKRPSEWQNYDGMEDQIWEIDHFKNLCLFLRNKIKYEFEISYEDETCIYVTVRDDGKIKAECYVNRGDTEEPVFSIYFGEEEKEYHGSNKEEIYTLITYSLGYFKE